MARRGAVGVSTSTKLSAEEMLTTTRAVRRGLDLDRPVDRSLVETCIGLARFAPSGSTLRSTTFVVVDEPDRRAALAELYRAGLKIGYADAATEVETRIASLDERARRSYERTLAASRHLYKHVHRVPVLVVACAGWRHHDPDPTMLAGMYGSAFPAVWSFMLACRLHGLGTVLTTAHLHYEREAAALLGIPYDSVTQIALVPVAHTGVVLRPANREPVASYVRWNRWDGVPT